MNRVAGLTVELVDLLADYFLHPGGPVDLAYSHIRAFLVGLERWTPSSSISCPEIDPRSDHQNLRNVLALVNGRN